MICSSLAASLHITALAFFLHPIHISVTEIEYDQREQALEIMMRVFIDDLEVSIQKDFNQPDLDILEPVNGLTLDQMAERYLARHFSVSLDNKIQKIRYLGHELESDALIFYIEVSQVKKWNAIQIRNSIITETYDDQSNLVHVTVGDKVKSVRLTKETPSGKLTFDNE